MAHAKSATHYFQDISLSTSLMSLTAEGIEATRIHFITSENKYQQAND